MKIQGWYITPPDFDPAKKYPMQLHIHGGPHSMYGVGFNYGWQEHAANGYVILYTNPRGSTGYGSSFGNQIMRAYPSKDFDDLMAGVDELVKKGFVDTRNMFVTGCSGGGVLTAWTVGHTDRFAAASANCPVIDWLSFVGTTDGASWYYNFEKLPWEDPSEHLRRSPLTYVGNVKTPTMLMTGVNDLRTPMPQTEQFYSALKLLKVPTAMVRFNDEWHGTTSRPSNFMRTQLYMRYWFDKHKRPPSATTTTAPAAAMKLRPPPPRGPRMKNRLVVTAFADLCRDGVAVTNARRSRHHRANQAGSAHAFAGDGSRRLDERRVWAARHRHAQLPACGGLGREAIATNGACRTFIRNVSRSGRAGGSNVSPRTSSRPSRNLSSATRARIRLRPSGAIAGDVVRVDIRSEADFDKYKGQLKGKIVLPQAARRVRMLEDRIVLRMNEQDIAEALTTPIPATTGAAGAPGGRGARRAVTRRAHRAVLRHRRRGRPARTRIGQRPVGGRQRSRLEDAARGRRHDLPGRRRQPRSEGSTAGAVGDDCGRALQPHDPRARKGSAGPRRAEHPDDVLSREAPASPNGINIVARDPGNDLADEVVIMGAHFDTTPGATGATDNATGSAAMMEAVRVIKSLGLRPRRTIRVALWGGEEQGLLGSRAYVAEHYGTEAAPETGTREGRGVLQPR